jgi:hypothetical protein
MTNYRPVSLQSFEKYLVMLCTLRLIQHLCIINILVPEQSGFRRGMSTENTTYKLTNFFKSLNQKREVGRICCYLADMFDCVNHEILIEKLRFYGIQGKSTNWFRT